MFLQSNQDTHLTEIFFVKLVPKSKKKLYLHQLQVCSALTCKICCDNFENRKFTVQYDHNILSVSLKARDQFNGDRS